MNNLTPPTDSLYKFVSIFCLGLIIASIIAIANMHSSHNRFIYESCTKLIEMHESAEDETSVDSFGKMVAKLAHISKSDVKSVSIILSVVICLAFCGAFETFWLWYVRDQKIRDELLALELEERKKT